MAFSVILGAVATACLSVSDVDDKAKSSGGASGASGSGGSVVGDAAFGGGSSGGAGGAAGAATGGVGAGGAPPFAVAGAVFDGWNDWLDLQSPFAGVADSYRVTGSMWFRRVGLGTTYCIGPEGAGSGSPNQLEWTASNQFRINWRKSGGGTACDFMTSAITDTSAWHHIAFSFDLSSPSSRHLYVDGQPDLSSVDYPVTTMDDTASQWGLFADNGGNAEYHGEVAEFWLALDQYLDLGTNLGKFRSADGKPVDLGTDGALPTGTAPTIYLSLRAGDAPGTFAINRGTGGGFTLHGILTASATSPSD